MIDFEKVSVRVKVKDIKMVFLNEVMQGTEHWA
jgi:hypothetical protein